MFDTKTHKEAEVRREENNCVQHPPQNRNHETARLAVTLAMSPSAEMKTTPTNSFLNSTTAGNRHLLKGIQNYFKPEPYLLFLESAVQKQQVMNLLRHL